jgi:antitoxin (DNA-binding transcriptional repressor) of toxin-antitoxin stability system
MHVSMQEFKSHLAKYVGQAQSGQMIELTSHRKVVAHIIGVPPSESEGVTRLLASGAATWNGGKPKGAAFVLQEIGKSVSAMVLEDRG